MQDVGTKFGRRATRSSVVAAALVFAWSCFSAPRSSAQVVEPVRQPDLNARLLTVEEGRSIIQAAWQADPPVSGTVDCSHLVHRIYASAGFDYPYGSSFELYAGHENFVRVKYPRAGDVIAWPGHVGIVVDAQRHSFYSLVREGAEELDYESPYWMSRGRPRFYRYRVEQGEVLSADTAPAKSKTRPLRNQNLTETANVDRTAAADVNRPAVTASQKTAEIYGPPAPMVASSPEETTGTFEIPASVTVATGNATPTREDVAGGISEMSDAMGRLLRTADFSKAQQTVVIVEKFSVQKVEIKHDRGWAHLLVDSKVSIDGGRAELKARREKVRWELRRTDSGWEAVPPVNRTYVPRDVAVKNLAAQLATISASDKAAQHEDGTLRQEAQIAGILNALLATK
ncbi:MAG: hypothetical protein WBG02_11825 [Candidatus Acidiferrum sp.]